MKLQFKHQKFQADAAKAVVDVFAGQPYLTPTYMMDRGTGHYQLGLNEDDDFTGWSNAKIVPELSDGQILEHIRNLNSVTSVTHFWFGFSARKSRFNRFGAILPTSPL